MFYLNFQVMIGINLFKKHHGEIVLFFPFMNKINSVIAITKATIEVPINQAIPKELR